MIRILVVTKQHSKSIEVEAVPRVGEAVTVNQNGVNIVYGVVYAVEHFYNIGGFREITVKVK